MSGTRRSNRKDYWRSALTPLIDGIQATIKTDIEDISGRLGEGAARLTAQVFMLDYASKNDAMVAESFRETVDEVAKKAISRPWAMRLIYFLRGNRKRTGLANEAFNQSQYVLAYLFAYYKPVVDPTYESVLEYINEFPGSEPDSPKGFNAIRLDWDKKEEENAARDEKNNQENIYKEDEKLALALGYTKVDGTGDVEAYRAYQEVQRREAHQVQTRERLNREIEEIIPLLIENSQIVNEPQSDGGYYFWANCHWRRLQDAVRDRMILRGGRATR